jgi:hypothetical protein
MEARAKTARPGCRRMNLGVLIYYHPQVAAREVEGKKLSPAERDEAASRACYFQRVWKFNSWVFPGDFCVEVLVATLSRAHVCVTSATEIENMAIE